MLENNDRIAQSARGRFFPFTVSETIKVLRDLGFATPSYQKRIDIIFRNSDATGSHGNVIAAFYPADKMIVYSASEDLDRQRAKIMLEMALREFAELGKSAKPTNRRQMSVSFLAYHAPQGKLIITKRVRRATQVKYRGDQKFSNAFKPKGVKTDEQFIKSLDLI